MLNNNDEQFPFLSTTRAYIIANNNITVGYFINVFTIGILIIFNVLVKMKNNLLYTRYSHKIIVDLIYILTLFVIMCAARNK